MQKESSIQNRIDTTLKNTKLCFEPIFELVRGFRANTIPWVTCAKWTTGLTLGLFFKIDWYILSYTRFTNLYPYHPLLYKIYALSISTSPFWIWAWMQVKYKKDKLKLLTRAFKNAGLESKIGRLPNLISDFPLDPMTRKLRLTNAGFPVSSFQAQSKFIESELGIFIDEVKESRESRTVDVIYSHYPMATEVSYSPEDAEAPFEFKVGQTRANTIATSLQKTPHLLVAGQTGGGKSTFLRQLIVHLHLQKKGINFLLIDLKGGLEFSMFENRKNFVVVPHVLAAVVNLQNTNSLLDKRMSFLKENGCKDIEAYFKKKDKPANAPDLSRHVIVVDEAAEMFLAGHHAKSKEVQTAREMLSRIARQGRALGIHLIVATQRPDSKSLDPQVKANLTGVICFQMMNDSSSIAVLGNGRATDLPKVAGRAIWKNGIEMLEVQTPFLSSEMAESLLGPPDNQPTKKESTIKLVESANEKLDPLQTE
ncbi:MAG: hypothetical protein A4S09_06505 [Proteobacteria bacterium SG_bin7]|nr:MAG: hypothetical protein A4S09_06505 [Proteobacteria bacterium SG_bin7]